MIRGEPITILRPHITGVDQYGTPTRGWTEETIDNVLVNQIGRASCRERVSHQV